MAANGGAASPWFYLDAAAQHRGPYSPIQLRGLQEAGSLTDETLVWKEGLPEWLPLAQVSELAATAAAPTSERPPVSNMAAGTTRRPADTAAAAEPEDGEDEELRRWREEVRAAEAEAEALKRGRWRGAKGKAAAAAAASAAASALRAGVQSEQAAGDGNEDEEDDDEDAVGVLEGNGHGAAVGGNGHDREQPGTPPEGEREFEDDDGTKYKWDGALRAWVPQEEGVPSYQPEDMTYVEEEEVMPSMAVAAAAVTLERDAAAATAEGAAEAPGSGGGRELWGELNKGGGGSGEAGARGPTAKRKADKAAESEEGGKEGEKKEVQAQPEGWFDLKVNTSVYISGLPDDTTMEEVEEVFSKCGIVKPDAETGKPRIKLYQDKVSGTLKGDGLVTYLKEPSVDLALKILDGAPLRPGDRQAMTVTRAKFEQKGEVFVKKAPSKQKKKKAKNQEQRALGWGGFDDAKLLKPMTVLLKYMFTREELVEDPSLLKELEGDVAEECSKMGAVEKVRVFENHPEGVVTVRFKDKNAGLKCIEVMNGRWFAGRMVEAQEDTGLVNHALVHDAAAEEARLQKFSRELEED